MVMPKFPKRLANQTVQLKISTGETNDYNQPIYNDPITINHCVFQPQTIYSGTNNNRQLVANAIVFLYVGVSSPMPVLSKDNYQSVITFEGNDYALQSIVDNRDPFNNELWSYELEVL